MTIAIYFIITEFILRHNYASSSHIVRIYLCMIDCAVCELLFFSLQKSSPFSHASARQATLKASPQGYDHSSANLSHLLLLSGHEDKFSPHASNFLDH